MDAAALSREILSLLELRESAQVPPWAAGRLCALLDASHAQVLRVLPVAAARRPEAGGACFAVAEGPHAAPEPVNPSSDLGCALESRQPVSGAAGLWVPLAALDEIRYVVGITGARRAEGVIEYLYPALAAYFARLVDAETDPLTQLANRRSFYSDVSAGLRRWAKAPGLHFIAVADIDHFKQVNDTYGHLFGDEILIHFARLMRRTFRAGDLLFRFGGEEFVAVYGVKRGEEGARPLERFRAAVAGYAFPGDRTVTASIGFVAIGDGSVPATTLIDRADRALYHAKAQGRNRVCSYEELLAAGAIAADKPPASEATLF
ncbi:MAG TPA: GGDEF domain-containing protein [Burkholderiales bacterium]|nr:GGDEF domain-containing protein [Burkholderiales bacterium]